MLHGVQQHPEPPPPDAGGTPLHVTPKDVREGQYCAKSPQLRTTDPEPSSPSDKGFFLVNTN